VLLFGVSRKCCRGKDGGGKNKKSLRSLAIAGPKKQR